MVLQRHAQALWTKKQAEPQVKKGQDLNQTAKRNKASVVTPFSETCRAFCAKGGVSVQTRTRDAKVKAA